MSQTPSEDEISFYNKVVEEFELTQLIRDSKTIDALFFVWNYNSDLLKAIGQEMNNPTFAPYTHGKRSTYVNHKCSGVLCRAANTAYSREVGNLRRKDSKVDKALAVISMSHEVYKARAGRE